MSWHLHVTVHGRPDILHLQLTLVHCFVQARKMRSAHASGPEGRDLRTDTKTLSSSLHPMVSGGGVVGAADDIVAKLPPDSWPV